MNAHRRREAKARRRAKRTAGLTRTKRTPLARAMNRAALGREGQERIFAISDSIGAYLEQRGIRTQAKWKTHA